MFLLSTTKDDRQHCVTAGGESGRGWRKKDPRLRGQQVEDNLGQIHSFAWGQICLKALRFHTAFPPRIISSLRGHVRISPVSPLWVNIRKSVDEPSNYTSILWLHVDDGSGVVGGEDF